ncbi:Oxoglutarate/iron-dependent dioxygenase [Arabidopsis thaliana x Arabidopsis arenosa]|uniref:Oxoglutarate/iron-dependent dioxygenase n=1 Tax=Arabidopsis thaliana x Arabidopsis arenosa TaxID=1240361 RepID=A0A8T1YA80_9BRAS|nr:Oxoglutarate/iron-dependent dioxygenase [Arabidopsis thaliana x Arabidopsis arenosa]
MGTALKLPIIDLSSPEKLSTSRLIRQACLDHGFFYLTNHGVSEEMIEGVLMESKKLFSLPLDEKMVMARRGSRGYSPLYDEKHESSATSKGDSKEMFTFGSSEGVLGQLYPNEWPLEELLPLWRQTMECYYKTVMDIVGKKLLGLVALSLNLEENFFEQVGAFNDQAAVVRLLRYPGLSPKLIAFWGLIRDILEAGLKESTASFFTFTLRFPICHIIIGELNSSGEETCGASAHSDFGMITLLATDGVAGLQVCRDKDREPKVWEDVAGIKGTFVVNIGDLMERWTNGLFRSTMHRVVSVGKERYSVAVFVDPDPDCVVECLESCCSETSPPRFPPVRARDYFHERFSQTLASYSGSD